MKDKILLYLMPATIVGLLVWHFVDRHYVAKENFELGIREAESRIVPNVDTLIIEVKPDTVTVERIVVKPIVKVVRERDTNYSVLTYPIDTTLQIPYTLITDSSVSQGEVDIHFKTEFWYNLREYRNTSFAINPIKVQKEFKTITYEKPMPADNYGLWLELSGYNLGTGLSLGYSNFSVKAIHSFEQSKVFDWIGCGVVIRLD